MQEIFVTFGHRQDWAGKANMLGRDREIAAGIAGGDYPSDFGVEISSIGDVFAGIRRPNLFRGCDMTMRRSGPDPGRRIMQSGMDARAKNRAR